ncbi:MAG: nitroreductase [Alphaproteobacteria bacterium]|nr:nitroreductase [Alphaproteobacteria bacterium]MBU2083641.1 nitroreductase [Alphaproteobacteria bacterium]MBU2143286.1 nitroreductase [Alphaproteobacteria bacterium]MBU2195107.1 nitroreductase [Alphaproteobacteria bacterium]
MANRFPPAPPVGTPMLATRPSADARALLALRRSVGKQFLTVPGPSPEDLDELLTVAARVPDHRKLTPWRFIVFEGDERVAFGQALAKIHDANTPDAESQDVLFAAGLPLRAPVVVAVISSPDHTHKTPVWEQELSAGAVCHNLLLAANAAGWAGVWLTEWLAFDKQVDAVLGLKEGERVAGYIYLGTATMTSLERPRADMSAKVTRWKAPA